MPTRLEKKFRRAGYYQPLHRTQPVGVEDWYALRELRERTQICKLETTATITESSTGFRLRVQVSGTDDVPVVIEIGLLGEGKLEGGLDLRRRFLLAKGGDSGTALVEGKPEESLLYRRITAAPNAGHMPPAGSNKSLSADQTATLKRWIEEVLSNRAGNDQGQGFRQMKFY